MFSAIFIRRPRFALVISLFLMLAGILCVNKLPIAEYPQVSPPTVMVMATYPGASAQVIADTVASPLESEVNGIEDMVYYSSQSDNLGNYTLTLTFKSGADEDMALVNVNNAVNIGGRNQIHPYYLVYVKDNGEILHGHLEPKACLDLMRSLCKGKDEHDPKLCAAYNKATRNGKDMRHASKLLEAAVGGIIRQDERSAVDSLF